MDHMLGKWKLSSAENLEAYYQALNFPPEAIEKAKKMDIRSETTREGDTYTILMLYDGMPDTMVFKLGQPFTTNSMGTQSENIFTMNGEVLEGSHTFNSMTTKSRRYIKDGKMVMTTAEGRPNVVLQIMDAFLGKWKQDLSATENWKAYAEALKVPADKIEKMSKSPMELVMTKDGNTYTAVYTCQDFKDSFVCKVGEKVINTQKGVPVENTVQLEGEQVNVTQKQGNQSKTSRLQIKDGKMFCESEAAGVKMRSCFLKC